MATLNEQLEDLQRALELMAGRVPADIEARAQGVIDRVNRRQSAGPQTVVALAGATGSGKSSLFNALAGVRLAEQGARRPTTSATLAVSFATTNVALLDLMDVARRYEAAPPAPGMADLVLLDLPDHDSAARAHREEVDRMVAAADQLVWVLDPQKYADAAVHERYLRRLTRHRDVSFVVLNQADRLNSSELARCLEHLRQLLIADGLSGVPLLATSTLDGRGVNELRDHLMELAATKRAATQRLSADMALIADDLRAALGDGSADEATPETCDRLTEHLAAAAGVPVVVSAVREAMRHRGLLVAGWPVISWIERLRPDPLKRLRLGDGSESGESEVQRSKLPARSATAQAQLSTGLRGFAAEASAGMPQPWQASITEVVQSAAALLPDQLDRALVSTDLNLSGEPVWWRIIRALHWVLIGVVIVGFGWLITFGILDYLGSVPQAGGLMPALLLGTGLVGGVGLHVASGLIIGFTADRAADEARQLLEASIARVAQDQVVRPAEAEVARYREAKEALARLG